MYFNFLSHQFIEDLCKAIWARNFSTWIAVTLCVNLKLGNFDLEIIKITQSKNWLLASFSVPRIATITFGLPALKLKLDFELCIVTSMDSLDKEEQKIKWKPDRTFAGV